MPDTRSCCFPARAGRLQALVCGDNDAEAAYRGDGAGVAEAACVRDPYVKVGVRDHHNRLYSVSVFGFGFAPLVLTTLFAT